MKRVGFFTFLEVLIVVFLVSVVSSVVVWKIQRLIEKKRFHSSVDQIECRMACCRKLAIHMQADWKAVLELQGQTWSFFACCQENCDALPTIKLGSFILLFNKKPLERIEFDFSSTGEVSPKGTVSICNRQLRLETTWDIPGLFLFKQGKKSDPFAPESPRSARAEAF